MNEYFLIGGAVYIALYLVKTRYIVRAITYFCNRLQHYGKGGLLTPDGSDPTRATLLLFSTIGLTLGFFVLIPMLLIERTNFFVPYFTEDLDRLAKTATR